MWSSRLLSKRFLVDAELDIISAAVLVVIVAAWHGRPVLDEIEPRLSQMAASTASKCVEICGRNPIRVPIVEGESDKSICTESDIVVAVVAIRGAHQILPFDELHRR